MWHTVTLCDTGTPWWHIKSSHSVSIQMADKGDQSSPTHVFYFRLFKIHRNIQKYTKVAVTLFAGYERKKSRTNPVWGWGSKKERSRERATLLNYHSRFANSRVEENRINSQLLSLRSILVCGWVEYENNPKLINALQKKEELELKKWMLSGLPTRTFDMYNTSWICY
jgi:hypothetical protein